MLCGAMCRFSKSVFPVAAPNPPSPTPAIGCAPNVSEPRSARLERLEEALFSELVERVHDLRLGDRDAEGDDHDGHRHGDATSGATRSG